MHHCGFVFTVCDWGWEGSLQCVIGGGRVVYSV